MTSSLLERSRVMVTPTFYPKARRETHSGLTLLVVDRCPVCGDEHLHETPGLKRPGCGARYLIQGPRNPALPRIA